MPRSPSVQWCRWRKMAADAVLFAAREALEGRAKAVVTAPLHKKALSLAGIEFPGHTEMLQAVAANHLGVSVTAVPVRMMLSRPGLRVVLVSIHVSLRQAIDAVTAANVLQTLQVTDRSWQKLYGYRPHMWVAGLNPHAGEEGLFGQEEIVEIALPWLQPKHKAFRSVDLFRQTPCSCKQCKPAPSQRLMWWLPCTMTKAS